MAKYNLTSSLEKDFTFEIDGKEFLFRKPTVREMRGIAKKFSGIEKEKNEDKQLAMSDAAMAELYSYIKPIGHEEQIADVIADLPVTVQTNFNDMIKKELGANG